MNTHKYILSTVLVCVLILCACAPAPTPESQTPTPTIKPPPTPCPTRNVALHKPVRVSASWVPDPPERAVNGNLDDWWGAGGPPPHWIEIDLEGIFSISKIRVINEGPTGYATYQVYGRGPDRVNRLLHVFEGVKTNNQKLEFSPERAWEGISTIRIEIPNGSGWVGFREVQVYSCKDPEPLPVSDEPATPSFLAQVDTEALEQVTPENAIFMEQLAMLGRGTINELVWSPDGKLLAAASPVGVWLYDPSDLDSSPHLLEGHTREVLSVAFSKDGATVLSASQDGTVKLWDVATGNLKRSIWLWADFSYEVGEQKRDPEVWSVAFSPDGTLLAAGSFDGSLRLWNLATGRQEISLEGHARAINLLAFSPDGTLLASSSVDGSAFVWNIKNASQQATLSSPGMLQSLLFSPDGNLLAYGGDGMTVRLWDTAAGEDPTELTEHSSTLSLAFSPDGKTLASSSLDGGRILLLDIESGNTTLFKEGAGWNTNMAFSPDGKTLATYAWDGSLRLWDVATAEQKDIEKTHNNPVNSIAFNPQNTLLATGSNDGVVRLWEVETNSLHATLLGHSGGVTGLAFSPDGTLLASSSFDRTVSLWDGETGMPIDIYQGHSSYVRCVAFSPDGRLVASGSTDKTIRLWDVTTGEERTILSGHTGEVSSVAFSPDGIWLLSAAADNSLRLWEVATGKEVGVLGKHLSPGISAAFSPDGTRIASGSGDHWLHVWNLNIANGVATSRKHFSTGHPGWVLNVAFSPDGKIVASANVSTTSYWVAPGEIHLYSAENGFPLALLRGHTKRVTSIAFSSDGKLLASGSADGSVRLWGVRRVDSSLESKPGAGASTMTPTSPLYSFILHTDAGWTNSGFAVITGVAVKIKATGEVATGDLTKYPGAISGPDGQSETCPNYENAPDCTVNGVPYGTLVGKIGVNGEPFIIGSDLILIPSSSGDLYVTVNDLLPHNSDNSGSYTIFFLQNTISAW